MVKSKYIQITELFKRRLERGDYSFTSLPGAQKLAAETGVSYLTARQAIQKLIDDGVLKRLENGRMDICCPTVVSRKGLNIVYIRPSYSGAYSVWDSVLQQVADKFNCGFRVINYSHDDDPIIFDALDGDFDLVFLQFHRNDPLFLEKLKKKRDRLVTLFHDLTDCGIRCLDGPSPQRISTLMDYLYQLGHRNIDCFNSEPESPTVAQRIAEWRRNIKRLGCRGEVHNYPVRPFVPSIIRAYEAMNELITRKQFNASAIFTITAESAMGIMRSCYEHGIMVPRDLSLCSFGNPEKAAMMIPSLTIVNRPDPTTEIIEIFEYYLGLGGDAARLMYRPENYDSLLIGESTGIAATAVQNINQDSYKIKSNKESSYAKV